MKDDRGARRSMPISARIRASLVVLTLLPLVLVGGEGLYLGWNALSRSMSFLIEEVEPLSQVSTEISGYVQSRELALQGLADLSPLDTLVPASRQVLLQQAREQASGLRMVSYHPVTREGLAFSGDPEAQAWMADAHSELARQTQGVLGSALQGRRSRSRAVVLPQGRVILVLGQPLSRHGVVLGALVSWVDLAPALESLKNRKEGGALAVWLVDGPTVVATSGSTAAERAPFEGVGPGMRLVQSEGGPTLQGAVPVSLLGWYLKWVYPLPEVSQLFTSMVLQVGLTIVLVGLLAWILGGIVARRVAAPVEALSASTLAMARGDYSAPAPNPSSYRELEILTESFELMRQNLHRTLSENERLIRYTEGLLQARIQELRVLYNLSEASVRPSDADSLVTLLMDHLQRLLPDSIQILWLLEKGGLVKSHSLGLGDHEPAFLTPPRLEELPEGLQQPFVVPAQEMVGHALVGPRLAGRASSGYCLVPLKMRQGLLGVLEILAGPQASLEPGLVDLLAALSREVGLALENSQLYARSMAEKRFNQAVLEEMGDGVLTLDGQGRVATFNRAAERVTGWDRREVIGRPCGEVFRSSQAPHPLGRLVLAGAEPAPFEAEFTVRGGTRKVLLFNPTVPPPLHGVSEAPAAIVVFRDVSRIRELEDLRRDFTATISHELRTPLTAIKGYVANMLHPRARFEEQTVRANLGIIDQQVDTLNRLIADLLEAARLRNAALEVHPRRVEIVDLLQRRVEALLARRQQVRLEGRQQVRLEGEAQLWTWCDPEHLGYVVDHLLSNALKYSPPEGQVVVSAVNEVGRVLVRVQDFGVGIPPEQLERIFAVYHRLDSASTRVHYGVGVGLFIARRIVEAHGGTLTASSVPGSGSTFVVSLPAAEGPMQEGPGSS